MNADLGRASYVTDVVRLDDDQPIDVGFVTAPVHNPEGDVSMLAQIGQLPRSATGTTVKGWITELQATVSLVEQELTHGTGRGRLEQYRRWFGGAHHLDVRSDGPAGDRSEERDPGHPSSSATGTR